MFIFLFTWYIYIQPGISKSDWAKILNGIPQGSIIGPLLFNIVINDLMYSLAQLDSCTLYNYADDNSISCQTDNINEVKTNIEHATDMCINWFYQNQLKANSSKLQSVVLDYVSTDEMTNFSFNIGNTKIGLSPKFRLV